MERLPVEVLPVVLALVGIEIPEEVALTFTEDQMDQIFEWFRLVHLDASMNPPEFLMAYRKAS